jgi:hypothetical protein
MSWHDDPAETQAEPVLAWLDELDALEVPEADADEVERARLQAEILAAKARTAAAQHRAADRTAEVRAALRAEVTTVQQELAELERRHLAEVESVREAGRAEASRIIAEARAEVARRRLELDRGHDNVG